MEATINGEKVDQLESYRAQSEVFDLVFPEDNLYDVKHRLTRSVCDGYWLFIKPLEIGKHDIYFKGVKLLQRTAKFSQMKSFCLLIFYWLP
jgi:hypothetical protein